MTVIEPQAPSAQLGFHRVGAAAPATVVAWRAEFAAWLDVHLGLDAERRSDVILAVDEALSNVAEFAYLGRDGGDVTLDVRYSRGDARLHVEVSDRGRWRNTQDTARSLTRGRGLMIMRAVSDHFHLDRSSRGTSVRMAFEVCPT